MLNIAIINECCRYLTVRLMILKLFNYICQFFHGFVVFLDCLVEIGDGPFNLKKWWGWGETCLRTFSKFTFAHSHVCAQFSITIAHTTYVNKVLRLRTLNKYMLIVPLPLARSKLYICCPLLTTGRWK